MAEGKRAMIRLQDTTFDKIQAFYIDPDNYALTPTEEKIRKRWVKIITLMLNGLPKFKIANVLERDDDMTTVHAYREIKKAESLFGNIYKTEKEVEKLMWKEWVLDFRTRARNKKDFKAEAKALDMFAKYGDFDKDDLIFNPAKLEKVEIEVKIAPELEPYLKAFIDSGVADFNKLNVTDVDFETVNND